MHRFLALIGGAIALAFSCAANGQTLSKIEAERFAVKAKANLVKDFKDPDAARFRNLYVSRTGNTVVLCGEVNGKNGFGAYTGFQRFYAFTDSKEIEDPKDKSSFEILGNVVCANKVVSLN